MNKLFLLSFVFCSVTVLKAQTFTFVNEDTICYGLPGDAPHSSDSINNNSSTGFYIDVVRVQNNHPLNWGSAFCLDICYPAATDSVRYFLLPNEKQMFILHFFTDTFPDDTGIVLMKFKNVSIPSNTVYQWFYGITMLNASVNTISKEVGVKVFPSPISPNSTFCFRIAEQQNTSEDFTLLIYDVCGKTASRIDGLMNGDNYLSLNLSEGMYVYCLLKGNTRVKTGKIAVAK